IHDFVFLFFKCRVFVEYNKTGVNYICKVHGVVFDCYICNVYKSEDIGEESTHVIITSVRQFKMFY
ncbi:MAG TPA: hypothetical protein DCR38_14005, partial [Butyricimonas virosa]|nr:hypothetical protein [Butyricimonas virosa]